MVGTTLANHTKRRTLISSTLRPRVIRSLTSSTAQAAGRRVKDDWFVSWPRYILSQPSIPQTTSTSYGFDEDTLPMEYTMYVCGLFAQLDSRGVSILFATGNVGVGERNCVTKGGSVRFRYKFPATGTYKQRGACASLPPPSYLGCPSLSTQMTGCFQVREARPRSTSPTPGCTEAATGLSTTSQVARIRAATPMDSPPSLDGILCVPPDLLLLHFRRWVTLGCIGYGSRNA